MNIDKSKLKMGMWYEDESGNMYKDKQDNPNIIAYCTCYPLEVETRHYRLYTNKDTCKHPLKYRKRTTGWVKGIKGCACTSCGKTKVGKWYIPFCFMPWDNGSGSDLVFTSGTHLSKFTEKCILNMVNSGDYTLREAICIMSSACERCMNVLLYKYLNGEDGYEEYSDEWKKAGTFCDFCKDEKDE